MAVIGLLFSVCGSTTANGDQDNPYLDHHYNTSMSLVPVSLVTSPSLTGRSRSQMQKVEI